MSVPSGDMASDFMWKIDDFAFGLGTDIKVATVDFGESDMTLGDTLRAREDGLAFGQDYLGGRLMTFEMFTNLPKQEALGLVAPLRSAWRNRAVRRSPGAVSVLRYTRAGRTRKVFGRGRKFAADVNESPRGYIPITATFQCIDDYSYDDEVKSSRVDLKPSADSGMVDPLIAPITTTVLTEAEQGIINNESDDDSWLQIMVHGPISAPIIELGGYWMIRMPDLVLAYDDYIVIDSQPWSRSVRTRFGVNGSGMFTADSPRLTQIMAPPGISEITLRGLDPSGTSYMVVNWAERTNGE